MLLSKARRNDTAACTSKSFNVLEDAIGCGERNGESCGVRVHEVSGACRRGEI